LRDRLKHLSPNAAHGESFVAGALGIRLGGPTCYAHGVVDKPYLGDGVADISADHIRNTCKLVVWAGWTAFGFSLVAVFLIKSIIR
jgi:adenosylcobinamide-phosphate synthase